MEKQNFRLSAVYCVADFVANEVDILIQVDFYVDCAAVIFMERLVAEGRD